MNKKKTSKKKKEKKDTNHNSNKNNININIHTSKRSHKKSNTSKQNQPLLPNQPITTVYQNQPQGPELNYRTLAEDYNKPKVVHSVLAPLQPVLQPVVVKPPSTQPKTPLKSIHINTSPVKQKIKQNTPVAAAAAPLKTLLAKAQVPQPSRIRLMKTAALTSTFNTWGVPQLIPYIKEVKTADDKERLIQHFFTMIGHQSKYNAPKSAMSSHSALHETTALGEAADDNPHDVSLGTHFQDLTAHATGKPYDKNEYVSQDGIREEIERQAKQGSTDVPFDSHTATSSNGFDSDY